MSGSNSSTISINVWLCGVLFLLSFGVHAWSDEETEVVPVETAAIGTTVVSPEEQKFKELPTLGKPWVKLKIGEGKDKVWINQETKQVAVDGEVSLTKGYLEMFACILGTKEHESVVALHSKAFVIHTGLLSIGAEQGLPAQWRPTYQPASGQTIGVEVEWYDEDEKLKRTKGQQWVRDLKTKKALEHDWVFAGSLFYVDPETKKKYYRAEGGEIICVSNFPVSMMDLPIESSQANDELGFEAFTENIPKRRTPVRMYLTPKVMKDGGKKTESSKTNLPDVEGVE